MRRGTIRRFITTLLAVGLGAVYLQPYLIGFYAEYRIGQLFAQLEQQSNGTIGVRPLGYERGWFASDANSLITIKQSNTLEPLHVNLNHQVHHGFINDPSQLFRATFTPHLDDRFRSASGMHLTEVPFSLTTSLDIEGHNSTHLLITPFHGMFEGRNPLMLTWSAMDARLESSSDASSIGLQAGFSSLRLHESTTDLLLRGLSYEAKMRKEDDFLWLGDNSLALEDLQFTHRQGAHENWLQLVNPRIDFELRRVEDGLTIDLAAAVDAARVNAQVYGDASFTLLVRGLDEGAQRRLNLHLKRYFSLIGHDRTSLFGTFYQQLPSLARSSPSLNLNEFHAETPDGPVSANVKIKLLPDDQGDKQGFQIEAEGEVLLTQPLMLMLLESSARNQLWQREAGAGVYRADLAALKQKLLKRLLADNLIRPAGNGYLVTFGYSAGMLMLNGFDPSSALQLD